MTLVTDAADVSMSFFSSGALVLLAGLLIARDVLARSAFRHAPGPPTPWRVAVLNASRRRTRSLGMIATLASGCFLVLAVSSMQKDPAANADKTWSGTGGFSLYAETTTPIIEPSALNAAAPDVTVAALRVRDGDDASCLNLNHAQTPRVLGVNAKAMATLQAFLPTSDDKLWERLDANVEDGAIAAFAGDANTAMWGLKKKTGDAIDITDESGETRHLKLVGQLPMALSVFQGSVLISGCLVHAPLAIRTGLPRIPDQDSCPTHSRVDSPTPGRVTRRMDVTPTVERLRMFYGVENTYLSMFLALGGLAYCSALPQPGIVVLRNVFERRREIALMHALGFSAKLVFNLLLREHLLLLAMR